MLQHAGIRHMICLYSHSSIVSRSTKFLLTETRGSTSFQRKNGASFNSCAMYWQYVVLVDQPLPTTHIFADIQGCDPFLFTFNAKPRHCDTCDGSHQHPSRHCRPKCELFTCHSCFPHARKSPSKQIL